MDLKLCRNRREGYSECVCVVGVGGGGGAGKRLNKMRSNDR